MDEKLIPNTTPYKNAHAKQHYDRLNINVQKGEREQIQNFATERNYKSLNDFVVKAIYEKIEREK